MESWKEIQWVAPEHCLLLVGYDDNNYIFNDPLQTQPLKYYSKSSVEAAYKGLFSQAIVILEKEEPTNPPAPPVYEYGAVKNPVTGEIYPISFDRNFTTVIGLHYDEEVNESESKPTYLGKTSFNLAKFMSGLEFDDSLDNPWFDPNMPALASLAGMFIGGVLSAAESLERTYLDIHYYKVAETGHKKAVVKCGNSDYDNMFNNWDYNIPHALKDEHGIWALPEDRIPGWEDSVNEFAKYQYEKFKGVQANNNYKYDIVYTFDANRKANQYILQVFLGKDGKMYEYFIFYPTEKIEIVVSENWINTIERFNIIQLLNPVSELPEDIRSLFSVQIY